MGCMDLNNFYFEAAYGIPSVIGNLKYNNTIDLKHFYLKQMDWPKKEPNKYQPMLVIALVIYQFHDLFPSEARIPLVHAEFWMT